MNKRLIISLFCSVLFYYVLRFSFLFCSALLCSAHSVVSGSHVDDQRRNSSSGSRRLYKYRVRKVALRDFCLSALVVNTRLQFNLVVIER